MSDRNHEQMRLYRLAIITKQSQSDHRIIVTQHFLSACAS